MLSQNDQVKACYRRKEWPLLPTPINVRIQFQKIGDLQYISHLDLQRTLHRILVRAGIPMWYTQGFNPHAKIVFSTPLSVGAQSVCEMVDIRIDRDMPCEEIKRLLNLEVTEELRILDVYVPSTKFSEVVWADYEIRLAEENLKGKATEIEKLINVPELKTLKKTKSGEKEVDIIPLIRSFSAKEEKNGEEITILATLSVNSDNYLNPEILISLIKEKLNLLSSDDSCYSIMRTATYLEDGKTKFR